MRLNLSSRSGPAGITLGLLWLAVLLVLMIWDSHIIAAARDLPAWARMIAAQVTGLGHGGWMAQVTIGLAVLGAVLACGAKGRAWRGHGRLILHCAVVFFVILLASGIAVQILKHLIGRPRPDLMAEFGAFALAPLRPGTGFNSFPSGHSSTMAALAVLLCWLVPPGRAVWIGAAVIIGLSRIATLQHYASDVFAGWTLGAAIGLLGLSLTLSHKVLPPRGDRRWRALALRIGQGLRALAPDTGPLTREDLALAARLMLATLAALLLFQSLPRVDLLVSGLFARPGEGFVLASLPVVAGMRAAYWAVFWLGAAAVLLLWAMALRLEGLVRLPARLWGFALACLALGPGVWAGEIARAHWGRAAPDDVDVFGGALPFSAAGLRAGQCPADCAFVSDEASAVIMLAIVGLTIFWPYPRPNRGAQWLIAGLVAPGAGLPVLTGQHFLSDTVLAGLFMALIALVLFHALRIRTLRPAVSVANLAHDIRVMADYTRTEALSDLRLFLASLLTVLATVPKALRALRKPPGGWSTLPRHSPFPGLGW
jgi:membrane-associated phospholipid phosphatase